MRNALLFLLLGLIALAAGSCGHRQGTDDRLITEVENFEGGLGLWTPRALDTFVNPSDEINWNVSVSAEAARTGINAAKFSVDNRTDAAKVWLERSFDVTPNRTYDVTLNFDFGTTDFGGFNDWTVIAGAQPFSPQTVDDLPMNGGSTTGSDEPITGLAWIPKTVTQRVTAGPTGKLYVTVGVWGTWESQRVYFIDNVEVTMAPVWPVPPTT
jgi:hypothetical protein